MTNPPPKLPFIRKLCAHLPEEEILAAEARFIRYVEICIEIGARLPVDEDLGSDFDSSENQS
jgi:hypothetical protein